MTPLPELSKIKTNVEFRNRIEKNQRIENIQELIRLYFNSIYFCRFNKLPNCRDKLLKRPIDRRRLLQRINVINNGDGEESGLASCLWKNRIENEEM